MTYTHTHTHTYTPSVRLLWTSDQPDAERFTRQHRICTRDTHLCPCGIRRHNPSKRAASDLRLRPHDYRVQHALPPPANNYWIVVQRKHCLYLCELVVHTLCWITAALPSRL